MADLSKMTFQEKDNDKEKKEQAQAQAQAEDGVRTYTFRNIPPNLHRAWKMCSFAASMTMEEFALIAIQEHIKKFKVEQQG